MISSIKGKSAILHKLVFELRYERGFTYLDRCGRTINQIQRTHHEWVLRSTDPNPQNAPLISTENNCRFNFSALKLDLAIEKPLTGTTLESSDIQQLARQAEEVYAIVVDELSLEDFTRIGFRMWLLFASDTSEEAEEWLRALGSFEVAEGFVKPFGTRTEATSISTVVSGNDRKYRIALAGVTRSIPIDIGEGILTIPPRLLPEKQREHLVRQQKTKRLLRDNPPFAALIDVDAFQENPPMVRPKEFIESSANAICDNLESALGK